MNRSTTVFALLIAACAASPVLLAQKADTPAKAPASSEKVSLRANYKTGQEFKISQHITYSDSKSTVLKEGEPPMSLDAVADITVEYTVKVDGASESGTALSIELSSLQAKAKLPQGESEWTSTSPPDDKDEKNPVYVAFKPIVGTVTQVSLTPDGSIGEIKPDPRMRPPGGTALQPAVIYLTSSEHFRVRWSPLLCIKPGTDPVAVGASWTRAEFINAAAINARFGFEWASTLKGVTGTDADVAFTGDIKIAGLEKGKEPTGKVKDTALSGSAVWDTKAGLIKSCTWKHAYVMDINAGGFNVSRKLSVQSESTRK